MSTIQYREVESGLQLLPPQFDPLPLPALGTDSALVFRGKNSFRSALSNFPGSVPIPNNTVLGNTSGAPALPVALTMPIVAKITVLNPAPTLSLGCFNANAVAEYATPHADSIHVIGADDAFGAIYVDSFGAPAGTLVRSIINLRAARGMGAAPSATMAGDEVARLAGRAYGTTGFTGSLAGISVVCAENTTDTAQGASLDFRSTAIGTVGGGSTTVPPVRARLQPSGGFSVGNIAFVATDPGEGCINVQGSGYFGSAAIDSTRTIVTVGNVRSSDQTQTVAATSSTGAITSVNRIMFHAENIAAFTPALTTDSTLVGFYAAPILAATATTFTSSVYGAQFSPQVVSSTAGARLRVESQLLFAVRNNANDVSTYASNILAASASEVGHLGGPPNTIVTNSCTGYQCSSVNFTGTINILTLFNALINVGSGTQGTPNPVVGTYYAFRSQAPVLANGGSIGVEWGVSQESTTAKNQFLGNTGIGASPTTTSSLHLGRLPVSSVGLVAGDVWNNLGVLSIV